MQMTHTKPRGLTTRLGASKLYDELMAEKRAAKPKKAAKLFKAGKTVAEKSKGLTRRMAAAAKAGKVKKKGGLFHSTATIKKGR